MNIIEKIESLENQINTNSKVIQYKAIKSANLKTYDTVDCLLKLVYDTNKLVEYKTILLLELNNYKGKIGEILRYKFEHKELSNIEICKQLDIPERTYYRLISSLKKDY